MDGKVFNSRLSWLFALMFDKKVLFLICTLTWRVNFYVPCQEKGIIGKKGMVTLSSNGNKQYFCETDDIFSLIEC